MSERVMVIAAHPGDEVLGCGGTIARHVADGDDVDVLFVADGETSRTMRAQPNRNFMAFEASKALGTRPPKFLDFNDRRLDQAAFLDVFKMIEVHAFMIKPTIVYTHHAGGFDMDHWIVHHAVMNALEPLPDSTVKAIFAFEVLPSNPGFVPNHFVDIDCMAGEKTAVGKKWDAILCYETEMRAGCFDAIHALIVTRGFACGRHGAEAFMSIRTIVR